MELLRWARNPWSEEILVGLGWGWLWLAAAAGALFVIAHALYVQRLRSASAGSQAPGSTAGPPSSRRTIVRHSLSARVSHWLMAATLLTLLVTSFVPILGLQFPWVTIHWIAGILLTIYLLYHIGQTASPRAFRRMWIGADDVADARRRIARFAGRSAPTPRKPGKWPLENKLFHHLTGLMGVGVIATGLLMMLRVDTPFWDSNPYFLADATWGIVFVIHGFAAVAFVGMLVMHVYFAIRPEKRWLTWSMILGKITRHDYELHHDATRWPVPTKPTADKDPAPARPPAHATSER